MGRRRLPSDERRDRRVYVRLNETELEWLDELCKRERYTRSKMIRKLIVRKGIKEGIRIRGK